MQGVGPRETPYATNDACGHCVLAPLVASRRSARQGPVSTRINPWSPRPGSGLPADRIDPDAGPAPEGIDLSSSPGPAAAGTGPSPWRRPEAWRRRDTIWLVATARGPHPFPSRTRPLSLAARMVLQGRPCGRVRRRQPLLRGDRPPLAAGRSPRLVSTPPDPPRHPQPAWPPGLPAHP